MYKKYIFYFVMNNMMLESKLRKLNPFCAQKVGVRFLYSYFETPKNKLKQHISHW